MYTKSIYCNKGPYVIHVSEAAYVAADKDSPWLPAIKIANAENAQIPPFF